MTNSFLNQLAGLGPAPTSRRDALRQTGRLGAAAALAMTPFVAMATSAQGRRYGAASLPAAGRATDVEILNYALTLEYLEASFYRQGVASGVIAAADRPLFRTIRDHEQQHVDFLTSVINSAGGTPVTFQDSDFDFTANGAFDPFGDYPTFLTLAQAFEDTGVRAYKGQAAAISNKAGYLTAALQIHSVEGRHAAAVRRLRGLTGWIGDTQGGAPAAVYGPGQTEAGNPVMAFPAEANTSQGGVELTTALNGYTAQDIAEAFDEPLDMQTVLEIADPFVDGDIDGDGRED